MTNPGSLSFANPERTRRPFAIREALSGSICHTPATVFDAVSARIAHEAGFSTGILAGSIASHVQLAAPDWIVLTLTELAQTVRTICRASAISLVVDADHGFGNPINVLRCVEELEHAGAQGITIEDKPTVKRAISSTPVVKPVRVNAPNSVFALGNAFSKTRI